MPDGLNGFRLQPGSGTDEASVSGVAIPSVKPGDAVAQKTDWLAALQGRWNVELRGQEGDEPLRESRTAFVRNNRIELRSSNGKVSAMFDFSFGRIGPPQEIDLRPLSSESHDDEAIPLEIFAFPGIIEAEGGTLRICYDGESGRRRPIEFSDKGGWAIWIFTRPGDDGGDGDTHRDAESKSGEMRDGVSFDDAIDARADGRNQSLNNLADTDLQAITAALTGDDQAAALRPLMSNTMFAVPSLVPTANYLDPPDQNAKSLAYGRSSRSVDHCRWNWILASHRRLSTQRPSCLASAIGRC